MAPFILGDGRVPLQVILVPGKEVYLGYNCKCLPWFYKVIHDKRNSIQRDYIIGNTSRDFISKSAVLPDSELTIITTGSTCTRLLL